MVLIPRRPSVPHLHLPHLHLPRLDVPRRDEKGAVAVVTALLMLVLIVFVALVVDLGNARDVRRQAQNASDASALAAGNSVVNGGSWTSAVGVAKTYALTNFDVAASAWPG